MSTVYISNIVGCFIFVCKKSIQSLLIYCYFVDHWSVPIKFQINSLFVYINLHGSEFKACYIGLVSRYKPEYH